MNNFYPRSPYGERQALGLPGWLRVLISIHALLTESDAIYPSSTPPKKYFYPRSPYGERRGHNLGGRVRQGFLSTLSLRRATCVVSIQIGGNIYFYPRSPYGERPSRTENEGPSFCISIHALLTESDLLNRRFRAVHNAFLSTLSLRRATFCLTLEDHKTQISIHALLTESDNVLAPNRPKEKFLSTLSLRRATISGLRHKWASFYFYPRSPYGERQPTRFLLS